MKVRYSIRIKTTKNLSEIKKYLDEFNGMDIKVTRNIGKTINIQIRSNSTRHSKKIKSVVESLGEIELFHVISGMAAY